MVKVNKYLITVQLLLLIVIGQNIIQCAARIQTNNEATEIDLELIRATRKGNKEKVKCLIESGVNVDNADEYGYTALIWATARGGYKEIVELLIKAQANVNAADIGGETALTKAARGGYKEIVELLIKHGADVNYADELGDTALIEASRMGYKEIVELLINNGANVNAVATYEGGITALMRTAVYGHIEIIELLLLSGADTEYKNNKGKKTIDSAQKYGYQQIVQMLKDEPLRRKEVIKEWLTKNIIQSTSGQLFSDTANIIVEYITIEYNDLPLAVRLGPKENKEKTEHLNKKGCIIS